MLARKSAKSRQHAEDESGSRSARKQRRSTRRDTSLLSRREGVHSYSVENTFDTMDVKILPALNDNYMYLVMDKGTKEALAIDPVEPHSLMQAVRDYGVKLGTVLTTHHHWDHCGGNETLKALVPDIRIYGGDSRISALTDLVTHNDVLNVGNLQIRCLFTPCHTSGHFCYYIQAPGDNKDHAVFTGDTLFLGGCGRFFEGTAEQMYAALINCLSNLPEDTKVYCGHEYTLQNLKFANMIEPLNDMISKKLEWSIMQREKGMPTVPSTIGEEKLYNPFMRVTEPEVMKHANQQNPIETMKLIRYQKDNFK